MRIAMLVHNDMQGDARVAKEAALLAECGHSVRVFALEGADLDRESEQDGYTIVRVARQTRAPWSRPFKKLGESRDRRNAFIDAVVRFAPDVVHCHDTDTLPAGRRAADRVRASLVYDAHELFPDMLEGHGAHATVVAYWRGVERSIVPRCEAVIAVNDERARVLRERYGVDPVVVRNLPTTTPLLRTGRLRTELGLPADAPVLLYQGVLNAGRGLVELVDAVSRIEEVVLVFQGRGTEQEALAARARELGVSDRVVLAGWFDQSDLHEYACDADCGVVIYQPTSLNNRLAAPNKLWAYMMAGLCIASSDSPGLRAVVEGEGIGEVFDPCDPASIGATITRIVSDRAVMADMGARARQLAETTYNWQLESRTLVKLYSRLAEEHQ